MFFRKFPMELIYCEGYCFFVSNYFWEENISRMRFSSPKSKFSFNIENSGFKLCFMGYFGSTYSVMLIKY